MMQLQPVDKKINLNSHPSNLKFVSASKPKLSSLIEEVVSSPHTPSDTTLARMLHKLSVPYEVLINLRRRSNGGAGDLRSHRTSCVLEAAGTEHPKQRYYFSWM
jgi:hypothetical protein